MDGPVSVLLECLCTTNKRRANQLVLFFGHAALWLFAPMVSSVHFYRFLTPCSAITFFYTQQAISLAVFIFVLYNRASIVFP
jgi:hypothetical protein